MESINYVALLAAGVVSMAVGFLWYSPVLFGKQWMKLMGITKESMEKGKKEMPKTYAVAFVLSLIMAYVLTKLFAMTSTTTINEALQLAFWLWLGFVVTVMATKVLFAKQNSTLFAIDAGHQLASMLAMSVVLVLLK